MKFVKSIFCLWAVVCILIVAMGSASCGNDGGSKMVADTVSTEPHDSAYWYRYAHKLGDKAAEYYNNGQTDSLEAFAPEAMKICREHNQISCYYVIWSFLADEYIYDDEFDKAVAEAKRMQDTAISRHEDYGLFISYNTLGKGYGYRENTEESVKYFRKSLKIFPDDSETAPLVMTYYYLAQALQVLERYDELDSVLTEWSALHDKAKVVEGSSGYMGWCNSKGLYNAQLSGYMIAKGDYKAAATAIDSTEYYYDIVGQIPTTRLAILDYKAKLAQAQADYGKTLDYARQQYAVASEIGDNGYMVGAMDFEVKALEGLKRYQEALAMIQRKYGFKDSLDAISNSNQLNELNKRFEVNEIKMQAERQKLLAERHQLYLVLAIIVLAVAGGAFFAFYRYRAARRLARFKAEQERIENELKIARDIQMSMVPSKFPDYEGLDMYASMEPAKEVGGDLYGYVLNGTRLYFAVGDVSGKGVPASLFMAQATRLFRTMAHQGLEPAEICTHMNLELAGDDNINGMFVTMFLGMLNLDSGHLSFCNAGHNPPVIGGGEQQGDFLNMQPNAPIGLWPELEYVGEEIDTINGRPLFIYTDGLNEAENPQLEQFGDEKLLDFLRACHFKNSRQVIEDLKIQVESHRNGAAPNDDLTMMCLRFVRK